VKKTLVVLLTSLLAPACLTQGLWDWAADTYPTDAVPLNSGVDADGVTVILVALDGRDEPAFSLHVPADWKERVKIPVGDTGEVLHSPLYLSRGHAPEGALAGLSPTDETWFLRHEPETGSIDILTESGGGHLVVATADLPSEPHWGRRATATVLTAPAFVVDSLVIVGAFLFFSWLEFEFPWPWEINSDDEDSQSESSNDSSPVEPPSGLIHPARGPS